MTESKIKNYNLTVVYDVTSETPIRNSVIGKLKKNVMVDNLETLSDTRLRITSTSHHVAGDGDPIDIANEFSNRIEEEMTKILHSCSKQLTIKKMSVFIC